MVGNHGKRRSLLAVFIPMGLGITTAMVFLFHYLHGNKAIVTIRNATGSDMIGGQLRISSLPNDQEAGDIRDGDSAKVRFERFGDGYYLFSGQFRNGESVRDSGGQVFAGKSSSNEIILGSRNDSLFVEFR